VLFVGGMDAQWPRTLKNMRVLDEYVSIFVWTFYLLAEAACRCRIIDPWYYSVPLVDDVDCQCALYVVAPANDQPAPIQFVHHQATYHFNL